MTKLTNEAKERLLKAKEEIKKICKYYDVNLRPIDMHTIGLVNEEYVVNQCIENVEVFY